MPRNLDFSSLVPEHDTFTDSDGTRHDLRAAGEFGAVDLARVQRLQNEVSAALETLGKDNADEAAAATIESAVNDLLKILLPTVATERWDAVPLGAKMSIVTFWTAADTKGTKAGEAPAGQPAGS